MPTRSYYFPKDFSHVEKILNAEHDTPREDAYPKFRALGIAPLFSGLDLAIVLGIGPGLIIGMLRKQERHYRRFELKKRDGTKRLVSSPRTYLKVVQWWILDNILNPLETSPHAFGFVKGESIVTNASFHLGSRHFFNADIKSFFDSVSEERVVSVFRELGYSENTSKILGRLCSFEEKLPQGAPTSPAIGNQILLPLDNRLSEIAKRKDLKYSRYADDITFSANFKIDDELKEILASEVQQAGFELKSSKTRWAGPGGRTEVTGLVVRDFVQPPKAWRKRTRATLHTISFKAALAEKEVRYLEGIKGYASQFHDAVQMRRLSDSASHLLNTIPKLK